MPLQRHEWRNAEVEIVKYLDLQPETCINLFYFISIFTGQDKTWMSPTSVMIDSTMMIAGIHW